MNRISSHPEIRKKILVAGSEFEPNGNLLLVKDPTVFGFFAERYEQQNLTLMDLLEGANSFCIVYTKIPLNPQVMNMISLEDIKVVYETKEKIKEEILRQVCELQTRQNELLLLLQKF